MEEGNDNQGGAGGEEQKAQPQRGGRRGKKKQKFKPLDLSSFPDPEPSAPAQRTHQDSGSAWGGNKGGGSDWRQHDQQRGASSWGGNRGGGQNWRQRDQGYGTSQQYDNRSQGYYSQDRGSNVAVSKALVTLLRHGKPRDIPLDGAGYAYINEILKHPQFQRFNLTEKGILDIVDSDNKNRFELEKFEGTYRIRATQGHSVRLETISSGLVPLTNPNKHPVIVHGTYQANWRKIKKQGLNRMGRTHVHFAIGYIGETHVTSGMRNTCDIVIELDLAKAIEDGLKFFESKNGVVLSEGDKYGSVSPKYFKTVKKWNDNEQMFKDINFQFEDA